MDRISCAPAPRVKCLACFICVNERTVKGAFPGTFLDDCNIVFIVLAGCIIVCAALRLMAPHTMASQKCKRRSGVATAAAPPLLTMSVRHNSSSLCKLRYSSSFLKCDTTSPLVLSPILFKEDARRCCEDGTVLDVP